MLIRCRDPPRKGCKANTTIDSPRDIAARSSVVRVQLVAETSFADRSTMDSSEGNTLSLVDIIISTDENVRNLSVSEYCRNISTKDLLDQCVELDVFRSQSDNLYERVRACFFLYAIHRFHLRDIPDNGHIPYQGYAHLQSRQFEVALEIFLSVHNNDGPSKAISSALAKAYYHLGFQLLANQVRLSVKKHPGNLWMFQVEQPQDHPYSLRRELLAVDGDMMGSDSDAPLNGCHLRFLKESTPVRMDLSHCGWSDIFFLGMDYPEGARVLNASIDLAVRPRPTDGCDHHAPPLDDTAPSAPKPPIDAFIRVLPESILKLTSVDLRCEVTLTHIAEVFDFAKDYLGLLRAGVIAAGIVPLGLEKCTAPSQKYSTP